MCCKECCAEEEECGPTSCFSSPTASAIFSNTCCHHDSSEKDTTITRWETSYLKRRVQTVTFREIVGFPQIACEVTSAELKTSGRRKFSSAQSSCRLFCNGTDTIISVKIAAAQNGHRTHVWLCCSSHNYQPSVESRPKRAHQQWPGE